MPYVVTYDVILEDGTPETRELAYFPKPDKGDVTPEEAVGLIAESSDSFCDCITVTYVSHYWIPMPTAAG